MSFSKIAWLTGIVAAGYACFEGGKRFARRPQVVLVLNTMVEPEDADRGLHPEDMAVPSSILVVEKGIQNELVKTAQYIWDLRNEIGIAIFPEEWSDAWQFDGGLKPATTATPIYRYLYEVEQHTCTQFGRVLLMKSSGDILAITTRTEKPHDWREQPPMPEVTVSEGILQYTGMEAVNCLQAAFRELMNLERGPTRAASSVAAAAVPAADFELKETTPVVPAEDNLS